MIGIRSAVTGAIVLVTTVVLVLAEPITTHGAHKTNEHISEKTMNQQVRQFFVNYEKANSSSDPCAICALYADSFMFAGPTGVQAVKKEDFIRIVPKMKIQFSSMGISKTDLQTVETSPLDSRYLLANVVWKVNFHDSLGSKHVDVSATYVLERGQEDALSIVFQIDHQDLASTIRGQQNEHQ